MNRSCTVTEPNGSKQSFIYRRDSKQLNDSNPTILIATNWPSAEIPSLPYANTLNTSYPEKHNSFYWNRQQYAALNSTFLSSGNFNDLTVADYKLPRRRHWLTSYDNSILSGTLSVQRDPSPDGVTLGQTTWYDYPGKQLNYAEGTNSFPLTIARVLPNGQTSYRYVERNSLSRPTLIVTSYGDGSTSRTNNLYYYGNNRDLWYELGPISGEMLRGFSYNGNHQVLTYTNAALDVTTYNYDSQFRLTQRILPTGLTTTYTYGADGFVSQVTDQPINRTRSYTYLNSFVNSYTDDRGMAVTEYWDNLQRLTGVLYPDNSTISNIYTHLDVTATKDRMNNWTYFGYNAVRQKIAETNANTIVTLYGYCECGAPSSITRASGTPIQEVTLFYYDFQGNRTNVVYPDGTSITNKCDSLKRLTNRLDALSSTTYGYNNQGLLTSINNGVGQEQAISYDIEDRATSVTDANGVTVTQTFDNLGRLLTRTYPDNGVEKFAYSARGLIQYTNQLNLVTLYDYDAASRKITETNANNEIIRYTYNAASDLKTLTDGKNQVTTWNYDEYGRVTNKLDQASVEILRYKYDANSRLTNRWSLAKGATSYTYDAVGNPTLVDYPTGTTDIILQYDALNRVTNMVDATGTTKFTYYPGGLLNTEDGPWASDTVTNFYNNAQLRNGLGLQQPTGAWTNGFGYDAAHRLSTVVFAPGTFTYTYKGAGSIWTNLDLPNSARITNAYDNVARLTETRLLNNLNTTLNKHLYLYNTGNQRIRHTRTDDSYLTNNYDNIGQLKSVGAFDQFNGTIAAETKGYLYDTAWNLNKRTNNSTGSTTTFLVDGKNQVTNVAGNTYTYDGNGNLTNPSFFVYAYDAENQLTSVTYPSTQKTDFVYDGRGRLRKRIESIWTNSTWQVTSDTRYIYDGMRVIQERDLNNTPTVSYTRGNDLSGSFGGAGGIGGLLARSHGYSGGNWSTHNYYHADGNGNITMLIDASQVTVASYRYDSYGNTISSSGGLAGANVYRFSSKELITNWGLYYYGYRFYDPNLQRWLNRDPIGELGWSTLTAQNTTSEESNLYTFVGNSPTILLDAFGNEFWIIPPDLTFPWPRQQVDPNKKERDKCHEDCHAQNTKDEAKCRKLRTKELRRRCWEKIYEDLAKCIRECNRKFPAPMPKTTSS